MTTVKEGKRRYEVMTTGNARHYVDIDKEDPDALVARQDVRTLIRWVGRGCWLEDIHGWHINPVHVIRIRVAHVEQAARQT